MAPACTCVDKSKKVKSSVRSIGLICAALSLAGCTFSASSIETDLKTNAISIADSTPTIASDPFSPQISSAQNPGTTDRLLDEDTIRLAVTTADLSSLSANSLAWANQSTGSSGIITNIQQRIVAGQTCRSFRATRSAYDGVMLYEGDVCLDNGAGWWTRMLRPFGEDDNT